jgi:hypothetical protein
MKTRAASGSRQPDLMQGKSMSNATLSLAQSAGGRSVGSGVIRAVPSVFAVSVAFLLLTMNRYINVYDEGLILEGASRVAAGAVPHRDFHAIYGPAQFYILAGLFKLLGPSVIVERLWDTFVRAGIAATAFLLIGRAASLRDGAVAGGLALLWLAAVQTYGFPMFPALLCAMIAVALLVPLLEGRNSDLAAFLGGVSLGSTVLFRYDVGLYAFAAISCAVLIQVYAQAGSVASRCSRFIRLCAPCWAGLALVCAPVAVLYAADDVLGGFAYDIVYYPSHFYAKMRGLPFPNLSDIVSSREKIGIYLPFVLWAWGAMVLTSRHAGADEKEIKIQRLLRLLVIMSMFFYLKGVVRVSAIHVTLSIIPALLVGALCLRWAFRATLTPLAGVVVALGVAFLSLTVITGLRQPFAIGADNLRWAFGYDPGRATLAENISCRPAAGFERLACFQTETDRVDAISYIAANSRPSDAIFEGVPHHDKIFVNDMLIYFATGLRPATKWYHFDPGLQTSADIQAYMVAELSAAKPRFVVIDSTWANAREPNGSSQSSGVRILDDFIAAHYHFIRRFGTIDVLQVSDV